MIGQCPALSLLGHSTISGSLAAMDCQIEEAVEIGYDRLFGTGGAFAEVLTAALTVYIALIAYSFLTGRTRITVAMLSPRLTALVLVVTFVTFWPAYHTIFYALFMNGPDQVASVLLGEKDSALTIFTRHLDQLVVIFSDIGQNFQSETSDAKTLLASQNTSQFLFWAAGILLLLSTLGVLILTRLVLYLLLILGPVFILLALFDQTHGLFTGWLKSVFVFAIAPMLTVLGGNIALSLFAPLIAEIGKNQTGVSLSDDMQPVIMLFVGSVIYAALLFVLMRVTAALVRDWRTQGRGAADTATTPAIATNAQATAGSVRATQTAASDHIRDIQLSAALASGSVTGMQTDRHTDILFTPDTSSAPHSRVRGLGQRFRSPHTTKGEKKRP